MDMLVNLSAPAAAGAADSGGNTTEEIEQLLLKDMGARQKDLPSAVLLTIVYSLIFVSGTVGNICTCIIIVTTPSMQTTTNYYLFSLAVSDLLLLFFGLPPELYSIWEAYPWRLGVVFCYLRQTVLEITSYASVLTITSFTVERYLAVCHPLLAHKISALSRVVKIILGSWAISLVTAIPYTLHTRLYHRVFVPGTETPVPESLICNIPYSFMMGFMYYMFQISTFLFFIIPITIIIILYILIGVALRRSPVCRQGTEEKRSVAGSVAKRGNQPTSGGQQPRKVVIRMLVAVTVAFIVCWAPFHTQRLMIIYVTNWTPQMLLVQSHVFYISGVLYFVSATVNPILYNVISKRYRAAFKKTIFPCCTSKWEHDAHSGCNGRHTRPLCPSQAMLVMRNGSSSLRLVFRQESQNAMPSYESIPLTPPAFPADEPEMKRASGSGHFGQSSTSSTSTYFPSAHHNSLPRPTSATPPSSPRFKNTFSNPQHHDNYHQPQQQQQQIEQEHQHHQQLSQKHTQRLLSVPEESSHSLPETEQGLSDGVSKSPCVNGVVGLNVIENKEALRLMD